MSMMMKEMGLNSISANTMQRRKSKMDTVFLSTGNRRKRRKEEKEGGDEDEREKTRKEKKRLQIGGSDRWV